MLRCLKVAVLSLALLGGAAGCTGADASLKVPVGRADTLKLSVGSANDVVEKSLAVDAQGRVEVAL